MFYPFIFSSSMVFLHEVGGNLNNPAQGPIKPKAGPDNMYHIHGQS